MKNQIHPDEQEYIEDKDNNIVGQDKKDEPIALKKKADKLKSLHTAPMRM